MIYHINCLKLKCKFPLPPPKKKIFFLVNKGLLKNPKPLNFLHVYSFIFAVIRTMMEAKLSGFFFTA